jgi:hypothetical protein
MRSRLAFLNTPFLLFGLSFSYHYLHTPESEYRSVRGQYPAVHTSTARDLAEDESLKVPTKIRNLDRVQSSRRFGISGVQQDSLTKLAVGANQKPMQPILLTEKCYHRVQYAPRFPYAHTHGAPYNQPLRSFCTKEK